jgi:hypothetical protein
MSTDFKRALNDPAFFEVLRQVDRTRELPGSEHDQLLLYNLSILEYLNKEAWYALNPAVRLLEKSKPQRGARDRSKRKSGAQL